MYLGTDFCECFVLAVEIMDASGVQRAVLFPPKYEIPSSSTYVFLIGEDVTDAHLVSSFNLQDGVLEVKGPVDDTQLHEVGGHKEQEGETDTIEAQDVMIERLSKIYHYTHEPVDFASAHRDNLEDMTGHILVCGNMSSVQEFIKTLRSKHVPLQPVVLLFPSKPPAVLWQQLSRFPSVYFVEGTALQPSDLVRAGVLGVDKAVILASASDADNDPSKQRGIKHAKVSEERALGRLMDANSLFIFRSICTARPSANIVCQIKNSDNITYLMVEDREGPNGNEDDRDITLCPPFAAGHVFLSSVLDRLTAQVFYNGHLMPILRELVISGGATSGNFHETDVQPSVLYSLSVPSSFTGKTYQELFQYLVSKRASLPLGLFRLRPTDDVSPLPYVITNPHASLVLNADDRMFTLLAPDNILSSPLGVLSITAVEAHLPQRGQPSLYSTASSAENGGASGFSYCVIQSQGESKASHLCRNNVDPHWNFQAEFFVIDMEVLKRRERGVDMEVFKERERGVDM
jgi:hypothetical protein